MTTLLVASSTSMLLLIGCDVPFSPKGTFTEKVVVFTILDPSKNIQFARVYRTYDLGGFDPRLNRIDPQVRNARVVIRDDAGNTYSFKDTLLERDNSDRYASTIVAYYTDQLVPLARRKYLLEVTVPDYGKATAEMTVPEPFVIYVSGSRGRPLLADSLHPCNCIRVSLFGGGGAKGQLTRLFLDYTVKKAGEPEVRLRREVPIASRRSIEGSLVPVYPQPDRSLYMEFPLDLFYATIAEVLKSDPLAVITVTDATILSYAMEPNLYNYYLISHGFGDPLSVRLDAPDFTNILNGLGVFGALAVDSLTLPLP